MTTVSKSLLAFCLGAMLSPAQRLPPPSQAPPRRLSEAASTRTASHESIYNSVVRIEVATQNPDYRTPWNTGNFSGGIGTGFIIGKNKFLTNAHVVSNARRILVSSRLSPRKYPARILHIAHDCDLALLEVQDFVPFAQFPVLAFGGIPRLESQVRAIGYPIGGQRLSVTRGIVSRIDFRPYSHSRVDSHLVIQTDAAINPGNSGGPVLQNERVIGVAFQGLIRADNTGYIIPIPVIRRFLKDIQDGQYDHYTELGISEFPLYNPAMQRALGLPRNNRGIYVASVFPNSSAHGKIQSGDVILALDGNPVDNAGNIIIQGQRLNMNEVVERKFKGDQITIDLLRDKKRQRQILTLRPFQAARIYARHYGKKPRFVFFAGLTFQPIDRNLYSAYRFSSPRIRKIYNTYISDGIFQKRKDIVVLTRVENDSLTSHIAGYRGSVIDSVNGEEINSLRELHGILYHPKPPEFFVIRCNGVLRPIVIPSSEVPSANKRIMAIYGITRSSNLEE